jgi:ferredoxin
MRVAVDRGLCQGHAQCEDAAPDVFEVRDDGLAHVLRPGTDDTDTIARVLDANRRCPVDAILLSGQA